MFYTTGALFDTKEKINDIETGEYYENFQKNKICNIERIVDYSLFILYINIYIFIIYVFYFIYRY